MTQAPLSIIHCTKFYLLNRHRSYMSTISISTCLNTALLRSFFYEHIPHLSPNVHSYPNVWRRNHRRGNTPFRSEATNTRGWDSNTDSMLRCIRMVAGGV